MAVSIPTKSNIDLTKNIIIGYGEVVAVPTNKGYKYALPGNRFTSSKVLATTIAGKLDRTIRANMQKFNRHKFL